MINKLDYIGNEYQLYGVRVISLVNGKSNNVKLNIKLTVGKKPAVF